MKVDKNKYFQQSLYAFFIKEGVVMGGDSEKLLGYVEHSSSMSYDAYNVRLWTKKDVPHILKDFKKHHKSSDYFVTRIRSKKCPVTITFNDLNNKNLKKFQFRNHPFTVNK